MSDVFKRFLKLESASGIILILAALLAIGLANSALAQHYQSFLNTEVQVRIAALDINKPLLLWINDGFMAIFFLLVGLEVKREMLEGAFLQVQATFPAIAAVGGCWHRPSSIASSTTGTRLPVLAGRFRPQPTSPSLSGSWRCWASGYRPASGLLAGAGYRMDDLGSSSSLPSSTPSNCR